MARNKEDYHKLTNLYIKQSWLLLKKDKLDELLDFCEDKESKDLVFSLLERFSYLNFDTLNYILNELSDYIINQSGFSEASTQLLAMSWDDEADSGQRILDNIKNPIYQKGWRGVKTVNIFTKSIKNFTKGKTQILIIDEFVGSGKTLRKRLEYLKNNIPGDFEVKCCFVAGIKDTIDDLLKEGIDVFCPLKLEKGVSGHYRESELAKAKDLMLSLELKLAQEIKEKKMRDYSFGYGGAEALYSMEGCSGNTPNSVFPIFWWINDNKNRVRNTLLTRFEIGF